MYIPGMVLVRAVLLSAQRRRWFSSGKEMAAAPSRCAHLPFTPTPFTPPAASVSEPWQAAAGHVAPSQVALVGGGRCECNIRCKFKSADAMAHTHRAGYVTL